MAVRTATAVWAGTLVEGKGAMKFGAFEGPFTRASRFENGEGTNPEELLGAAHAGCFSMFLSALLTKAECPPTRVHTTAKVHIEAGPTITKIELETEAEVPGIEEAKFQELVQAAKTGCPVSKALAGVGEITVNAKLV